MQLPLLLLVEQGPPPQNLSGMLCVIVESWGCLPVAQGQVVGMLGWGSGLRGHPSEMPQSPFHLGDALGEAAILVFLWV